ncbi:hypothetical protein ACWD3C_26640, partial [Streptomyces sp. NPDC002845]
VSPPPVAYRIPPAYLMDHQLSPGLPQEFKISSEQTQKLDAVLTASGLGAGILSNAHTQALTSAVDKAEAALHELLSSPCPSHDLSDVIPAQKKTETR